MRTVKILHLYSKSMDLYGDYNNITVLCQRIRQCGCEAVIDTAELFEKLSFDGYDMVYIGHGKARNLAAAAEHFGEYADNVRKAVEDGQVWFVTGNARELFGTSFTTPDGSEKAGIGLFNYKGVETGQVYVSDMIGHPDYDENAIVYGFANRTGYLEGENKYPLFKVITGFGDGKLPDGTEGTHYKNFFGTWGTGPILVRNPSFMREIMKLVLRDDYKECDFTLEQKALDLVIGEFKTAK